MIKESILVKNEKEILDRKSPNNLVKERMCAWLIKIVDQNNLGVEKQKLLKIEM